jgi:uroporphyrinogen-III synthase
MRLIITRPLDQALPWLRALQSLGIQARALPLIAIQPVADAAGLQGAWQQLHLQSAVMFVSANAVAHFFAVRPPAVSWPSGVIAACTGPGTAAALRVAGVPEEALVAPPVGQTQESESLWAVLSGRDWRGQRVSVVRGEAGRDWLAERWRDAGAHVEFLSAYQRQRPTLDAQGSAVLAAAIAAPAGWIWHFSSAQAVAHLRELAPRASWAEGAALATHPRISQAALEAGFGCVTDVAPGLEAIVQSLRTHSLNAGSERTV